MIVDITLEMLQDELDRERIRRRDCERWLTEIKEALKPESREMVANWDGNLAGVSAATRAVLINMRTQRAIHDARWRTLVTYVSGLLACGHTHAAEDMLNDAINGNLDTFPFC